MQTDSDPIAAISTAPGRGGIGIVRASGSSADIACLFQALFPKRPMQARHALVARLRDAGGTLIDEGIVLWFPAPHSYTGEDVLEFQGHGGTVSLQLVLRRFLQAGSGIGLRTAGPGEFTKRAFLNGRMDLAQAEAVADLIDADSEKAVTAASRSLAGEFSVRVQELADAIAQLRVQVEAVLDFPEEEIDFIREAGVREHLVGIRDRLDALRRSCRRGAVLREGVRMAIAGSPNVGKSSLMNLLSGDEASIVTAVPGTTRDSIHRDILIDGIPFHVVDTAGLRMTQDAVEKIGVERARSETARADLIVWMADASRPETESVDFPTMGSARVIRVLNKTDLNADACWEDAIAVSVKTGAGIERLRQAVLAASGWGSAGTGVFLARERHLSAIEHAAQSLSAAAEHLASGNAELELLAEDLRQSADALGDIGGRMSADDLLGEIFSHFCIGK